MKDGLTQFQAYENLNLAINSAKAIGCSIVNIGAEDIWAEKEHLVLGMIWQVIRIGLMAEINLKDHPELYRLLEPGEDLKSFLNLPPEKILLRWVNHHLKNAGSDKRINNFSKDISDSEAYTILLNQLAPQKCDTRALKEGDLNKRAEAVVNNARKIDCAKFVKPRDIVAGNPKLNMAFVANLFNTLPGLEALKEEERANLVFPETGTREARAFQLWINSLGLDPFVNSLFEDLRDGLVLLKIIDKINPGTVNWKRVNANAPMHRIKQVENSNYAVEIGKELKFSLVGIGGVDITDGNETLTLALIWQLMRHHVLTVLKEVGGGAPVSEQQMIKWSNDLVASSGKPSRMQNFKDPSLKTSQFFLDLVDAIRPGCVDWSLVHDPADEVKKLTDNAKLVINLARKLGATIFLLPEDIYEGKDKMILTFVGSLMAVGKKEGK